MKCYTQLTQEQRYQIQALRKAELNQTKIAKIVGVHKSTVSRELSRNTGFKGYRPAQAQRLAEERRMSKVRPRISSDTWLLIERLLREDWSPAQISGWLLENKALRISHEWIYLHAYEDKRQGGDLYQHLRCQKTHRKRYGGRDRRGQINGRVSIDERPSVVDERSRVGDWEADTVIGKPGGAVLVTLVERLSKLSIIALAPNKTAQAVKVAMIKALRPVANRVLTMTYDNGKEFAHHQEIADKIEMDGYFAHPYHSWERGLSENTNGLIRQYLPKGTSFQLVKPKGIQRIMDRLNNRPRKSLGFKTPNQVFFGIDPPVALTS